jgi:DnaJ-class molecular chaperone
MREKGREMSDRDYYQILGVDRDAGPHKIKEAYRKLAFQFHPDRNRGNPSAVERMKEINEAYAVLSDPGKRRNYERMREQHGPWGYDRFRESYSEQDIFRGSDINQIFEEMAGAFGFRGFEEVFRESYGQGYRTFEFRRPGFFGRGFVFSGPGFRRVHPPGSSPAEGLLQGSLGKLARYFLRTTFGIKTPQRGKDWHGVIRINPREAHEGKKVRYLHRRKSKDLMINIPEGIQEGRQIRLRGMGEEGKEGGEPGDLYLEVTFKRPLQDTIRNVLIGLFFSPKK